MSLFSLANTPTLRVVTEEWPPFNFTNDEGQVVGRSTDVVRYALSAANIDYTLNSYPWVRAMHIAKTEPGVMIYSIYRNKDREAKYQWICPLLPTVKLFVYRLRSRPDVIFNKISEGTKYRTGGNKKDSSHQYLLDHGFEVGVNLDLTNDASATIRKFVAGRLDFLMQTQSSMINQLALLGLDYHHVEPLFPIQSSNFDAPCAAFSLDVPKETVQRIKQHVLAFPHENNTEW